MIGPTPDTWTWIGFRCPTCETSRLIRAVPHEDGSSGHYECWICGHQSGIWIDGGTLDLGLVRDTDLNSDNDYFQVPETVDG